MVVLAVDESAESLKSLQSIFQEVSPEAQLICHRSSLEALADARKREIDVALVEASMPELSGVDLGRYLKELYPSINLIFMSKTKGCAYDALCMHASGLVSKPVTNALLKKEMDDLRYSITVKTKRVFVQTFGNFEIFVDGQPITFKYSRTKEILAILVNNRGAQTTNGEIIASLWEDDGDPEKKSSYLSNLRQDLQNTLNSLKLAGLVIKQRGSMAIATDKIDCDVYDWLEKKKDSRYRYMGEYMNQYSWAEYIHAELDELSYEMED